MEEVAEEGLSRQSGGVAGITLQLHFHVTLKGTAYPSNSKGISPQMQVRTLLGPPSDEKHNQLRFWNLYPGAMNADINKAF